MKTANSIQALVLLELTVLAGITILSRDVGQGDKAIIVLLFCIYTRLAGRPW